MRLFNFLPLLFVLFLFQNCDNGATFAQQDVEVSSVDGNSDGNNGTSGDSDPDSEINDQLGDGGENDDRDVINNACEELAMQNAVINVEFPKPQQTCDWGNGGNLSPLNTYFRARIEQERNLGLPAGAVICDASFTFAQQDFLYDDHFLLTFNDMVIASSYDFTEELQAKNFGLLEYNWDSIAGMFWDSGDEMIFCPDIQGGNSTCSFPGHDQQGLIELDYTPSFIRSIMSNGIPSDHSFKMISIGDNDTLDCEHSDVEFDVAVKYVLPSL